MLGGGGGPGGPGNVGGPDGAGIGGVFVPRVSGSCFILFNSKSSLSWLLLDLPRFDDLLDSSSG